MPYQLYDGPKIESDDPAAIVAVLAERAFGGPLSVDAYTQDLRAKSALATGKPLESSEPADVVDFLLAAHILQPIA